jgi:hypothetical protein
MRKILTVTILASAGLALVLLLGWSSVQAQTAPAGKGAADTLSERIKAAKAKAEADRIAAEGEPGTAAEETQPAEEEKPKEKPKATKKPVSRPTEGAGTTGTAEDPYGSPRDTTSLPMTGPQDVLQRYDVNATPEQKLMRIRAIRAAEAAKTKGTEAKKPAEAGGIPVDAGLRNYRELVKQYSPDRVYLSQPQVPTGIVGTETLPGLGAAAERARENSGQLPDPSKNPDEYEQMLKQQYGVRGALPEFTDPSLRSTYEAQRFRNWLFSDQGVYVDPGKTDVSQLYNTYQAYRSLPPQSNSLGKRDSYVPNSTDFVNPTYRGSIYSNAYSGDPYVRSYSPDTTQSRYSSSGYYSMDTRESFSDYYQREIGVSNAFVPGSASRQFEVNTVKQWTDTINQYYGTNTAAGTNTFTDTYRLYSAQRKY